MAGFKLKLKKKLYKTIHEMSINSEQFSVNPGKDFSRKGKLGFEKTIALLLNMEGKSLNNEILSFFSCSEQAPSSSAFVQSRDKINSNAFFFVLFHPFSWLNDIGAHSGCGNPYPLNNVEISREHRENGFPHHSRTSWKLVSLEVLYT